jgi:hypothetical protein
LTLTGCDQRIIDPNCGNPVQQMLAAQQLLGKITEIARLELTPISNSKNVSARQKRRQNRGNA